MRRVYIFLQREQPKVSGVEVGEVLHQSLSFGGHLKGAFEVGDSPASVADVPSASLFSDGSVDKPMSHLSEVRMVLHDCGEVELIEKRNPMFHSLSKDQHVIGICIRVVTTWKYRIVVSSKQKIFSINRLRNLSDKHTLLLERFHIARVQTEENRWT